MKRVLLLAVACVIAFAVSAQPQVIAHRGYHATEGSARNSIASLQKAQALDIFGSECDVNLTTDGVILICHGGKHPDKSVHKDAEKYIDIQHSTAAQVQSLALENGETMPTLDEYLAQAAKDKKTKLIIEIKKHFTPELETKVVEGTVKKVAEYGLNDIVEYIAFRPFVCQELVRVAPKGTKIAYLNGDYEPEYVKGMGLTGIDYAIKVIKKHKKWIKECHKLGLTVNIWTVNEAEDIQWMIDNGVDYITTDDPVLVKQMIAAK